MANPVDSLTRGHHDSSIRIDTSRPTSARTASAGLGQSTPKSASEFQDYVTFDSNKICQWYCCDCGQAYGTIIWTDPVKSQQFNKKVPHHDSTSHDEADIIAKLKFYSLLIYKSPNESNYFTYHDTPERRGSYFDMPADVSATHTPDPLVVSTPLATPAVTPRGERIMLDPPTRFTCHRCNHMMCPYCLKIRYRDLDDQL